MNPTDETTWESGRQWAWFHCRNTVMTSALVVVQYNVVLGTDRLPLQVIRLLVTIALCVWLYRTGARVAVTILSVLLGIAGVVAVGTAATRFETDVLTAANLAVMGVTYLWFCMDLANSAPLASYLAHQRGGPET